MAHAVAGRAAPSALRWRRGAGLGLRRDLRGCPGHWSFSAHHHRRLQRTPGSGADPTLAGSLWPHPQIWWRTQATVETDKTLRMDLESRIEPATRGAPESPWRWISKSMRQLADKLKRLGHQTSHRMVAALLSKL